MQYKLSYYFFKLQIFYTYSSFFHKFQLLLNSQILHVSHNFKILFIRYIYKRDSDYDVYDSTQFSVQL